MKAPDRSPRGRKARGGAPKRPAIAVASDDPPFLEFWKRAKGTLPETIGEADLSTLNSALGFLFGGLRRAQAQFEREKDNGRWGAFTALGAYWMFITLFRTPHEEGLEVPILRLQDALVGLDHNRIEPILKPVRRCGRAPASHPYACVKGHAAATVQLLLQKGLARGDAHRAVARQLRHLVRPARGSGPITATTVRNWCDEVSRDVDRHGTAAQMYDYILARAGKETFWALPKEQAKQFALQKLAGYAASMFPELQKPT